eukprot:g2157.t1
MQRSPSGLAHLLGRDAVWQGFGYSETMSYRLDRLLSSVRGQAAILLLVALIFVTATGIIFSYVVPSRDTFDEPVRAYRQVWEGIWDAWTYIADPGTHADVPEDLGTRVLAMLIAWFGIVFFAVIIGFVVDAIKAKMEAIKQGRSAVIVQNHVVMLGWSSFSVAFIRELAITNLDRGGGTVVVLAMRNKQQLEAEFWQQVSRKDMAGTEVVFRMGSPMHAGDLLKVAAHTARAVLVLAPDDSSGLAGMGHTRVSTPEQADAVTLRAVLSLVGLSEGLRGHIVAQLTDIDNDSIVRMVGGSTLDTVVSHDMIGRLMLVGAREPALLRVYAKMLGFAADEFYCKTWPELTGLEFREVAARVLDATPVGIKRKFNGKIVLNPSQGYTIQHGDELIVIARDHNSYKPHKPVELKFGKSPEFVAPEPPKEIILLAGWRAHLTDLIVLIDSQVPCGTELHILRLDVTRLRSLRTIAAPHRSTIKHWQGNSANRNILEQLPMGIFTSVIICADEVNSHDVLPAKEEAVKLKTSGGAKTFERPSALAASPVGVNRSISPAESTSLAPPKPRRASWSRIAARAGSLRTGDAAQEASRIPLVPCICEILDARTQHEAIVSNRTVATARDFIQSSKMISQILANIVENRDMKPILGELLGNGGAGFEIVPAARFVALLENVSYLALVKRVQEEGQILCGYQQGSRTVMNPPKADKLLCRSWRDCSLVCLRSNRKKSNSEAFQQVELVNRGANSTQALVLDRTPSLHSPTLGGLTRRIDEVSRKLDALTAANVATGRQVTSLATHISEPSAEQMLTADEHAASFRAGYMRNDSITKAARDARDALKRSATAKDVVNVVTLTDEI